MNFFTGQEFADYGHFEFENERKIRDLFAGLDDVADDRQIERGEQVARLVEDEVGAGEVGLLAALRDYGEAGLVGGGGGRGGSGAAAEKQAGNAGDQALLGANEKGNLGGELFEQFRGAILRWSKVFAGDFHVLASFFPALR